MGIELVRLGDQSRQKSENTQQRWFGKPEHGSRVLEVVREKFVLCVCSVYYQPNSIRRGGPWSRPPGCTLGSVGNPFDRIQTGTGPQPPLVTYNLSSLALTPGEPTPYVCMYVSMVCGMYVSMCWVKRESTQVHREGGTVVSKGKKSSVCGHDGASSQGTSYVRGCSGASLSEVWVVSCLLCLVVA